SKPRNAPTTLTRGPGFRPTTTQAGIARGAGAAVAAPALDPRARAAAVARARGRGDSAMVTWRASPGATVTPPTRPPRAGGSTSMRDALLRVLAGPEPCDFGAQRVQRAPLEIQEAEADPPILLGRHLRPAPHEQALAAVDDFHLVACPERNVGLARQKATP